MITLSETDIIGVRYVVYLDTYTRVDTQTCRNNRCLDDNRFLMWNKMPDEVRTLVRWEIKNNDQNI